MVTANKVTKRNGVIMLAECRDGIGHKAFYELSTISSNPEEVLRYIGERMRIIAIPEGPYVIPYLCP